MGIGGANGCALRRGCGWVVCLVLGCLGGCWVYRVLDLRLLIVQRMSLQLLPLFKPLSKTLGSTDLTKSVDTVSEPDNLVKLALLPLSFFLCNLCFLQVVQCKVPLVGLKLPGACVSTSFVFCVWLALYWV